MIEYYIQMLPGGCRWLDVSILMRGIIVGAGGLVDEDDVLRVMEGKKVETLRQKAAAQYLARLAVEMVDEDAVIAVLRSVLDRDLPEMDLRYGIER